MQKQFSTKFPKYFRGGGAAAPSAPPPLGYATGLIYISLSHFHPLASTPFKPELEGPSGHLSHITWGLHQLFWHAPRLAVLSYIVTIPLLKYCFNHTCWWHTICEAMVLVGLFKLFTRIKIYVELTSTNWWDAKSWENHKLKCMRSRFGNGVSTGLF